MSRKLGIIGFGWMGYKHYRLIIPKDSGITVAGVYDIAPERLEFARELGLKTYQKLEDFLLDEEMEMVLVSTPNHLHKQYAISALNAGKHVICEKPVTLTSEELLEIMEAEKKSGKVFTIHQNRRWDEDFLITKKAIEEKRIGTAVFVESRVQGGNGIPGDWRQDPACGGGMLYDWGVHLIDQMLCLNKSPVVSVYAQLLHIHYEVDDNVRILLTFQDGMRALIEVMTICFQPLPRWHVLGTEGTMDIQNWECEGKIVKGSVQEVDWSIEAVKNAAGFTRTMRPRPKETVEELPLPKLTEAERRKTFYENFLRAVDGDRSVYIRPEEAYRTCKVMDACFESARENMVVKVHI